MSPVGLSFPVVRRWPAVRRLLLLGGSAAVIAAVAAAMIGRELMSADAPSGAALVRFEGRQAAFSISYPEGWASRSSQDAQVELLAAHGPTASLLIRVVPLDFEVLPEALPRARVLTDRLVNRARNVRLLSRPQQIQLGGLPGLLYIYTFQDQSTGQTGAHAHYFVFQGAQMITLVFQALPADRLELLAPSFERIAASFRAGAVGS